MVNKSSSCQEEIHLQSGKMHEDCADPGMLLPLQTTRKSRSDEAGAMPEALPALLYLQAISKLRNKVPLCKQGTPAGPLGSLQSRPTACSLDTGELQ